MTITRAEAITQAVFTLMGSVGGVTLHRSRIDALSRRQAPALVVTPTGCSPSQEPVSTCRIEWDLTIDLAFYARGATAETDVSHLVAAAHALLMADRTLGGLAINVWPSAQQWERDQADEGALWHVCPYTIRHRTHQHDLTA